MPSHYNSDLFDPNKTTTASAFSDSLLTAPKSDLGSANLAGLYGNTSFPAPDPTPAPTNNSLTQLSIDAANAAPATGGTNTGTTAGSTNAPLSRADQLAGIAAGLQGATTTANQIKNDLGQLGQAGDLAKTEEELALAQLQLNPNLEDTSEFDRYNDRYSRFLDEETQEPNEGRIRQEELRKMQAEIDATNRVYADKLRREQVLGTGRLGSEAAISGRRGLLGSDFGESRFRRTEGFNSQQESSIENERLAIVVALQREAKDNAAKEIKEKRAAMLSGFEARREWFADAGERKASNLQKALAGLVSQGRTDNNINEDEMIAYAKSYGVEVEELMTGLRDANTSRDVLDAETAREVEEFNLSQNKTQADIDKINAGIELDVDKFNQDKKEFGLNYAISQAELNISRSELKIKQDKAVADANGAGSTEGGFKGEVATQGRVAVKNMAEIAKANPGIFGRTAAAPLPGMIRSDAFRDYEAQLDSLKGNIIPATLTAMREASKTGGALGQVSDREGQWLAAALGALSMEQSPGAVVKQLEQIDLSLSKWQSAVDRHNSDIAKGVSATGVENAPTTYAVNGETYELGSDGQYYLQE